MHKRKLSILSIIDVSFRQMGTIYRAKNPMFLLIFILSCFALIILSKNIFYHTNKVFFYSQITIWLWLMMFLSSLVESIALLENPNFRITQKKRVNFPMIKKLSSVNDISNYTKIRKIQVRAGDIILLESGDEIPFDGEILVGSCYVSDGNITGSVDNAFKSSDNDNKLVAGSLIESNDYIIIKVRFAVNKSLLAKMTKLLKNIERQAMPSEIAFERLMLGLSILFSAVIFIIWVIADYSGVTISPIHIIALTVILLPTTIFALQKSIIYHSHANLALRNIKVQDQIAFDNAADINIILLDKTGTITVGQRQMVDFKLTKQNIKEKDYLKYLYLSSIKDETSEGKTIIAFTSKYSKIFNKKINFTTYQHLPFSATNPISGCNYGKFEIRKGTLKAIAKYLGKNISQLPSNVKKQAKIIAEEYGTPVVLTVNKEIIGIINLQDRIRRGVIKQLKALQDDGMKLAIITGDNKLTTAHIAQELNIDKFYVDQTPEKKLKLIKSFQKQGYVVAMCGDGLNDALALAQADIGYTFEDQGNVHNLLHENIVAKYRDLSGLLTLKKECQKITIKRGGLTIYSISSDLAKYFVIVPAIFTTVFPVLSNLNIMHFKSLESVILASLIFKTLNIPALAPLIFNNKNIPVKNRTLLWRTITIYSIIGVISPLLFIKIIEVIIYKIGLI